MRKFRGLILLLGSLFIFTGCVPNESSQVNSTNDYATELLNVDIPSGGKSTSTETSTDVDTSDWQTYTNEAYGISFRYPADWVVELHVDTFSIQSPETHAELTAFLKELEKTGGGTGAGPHSEMAIGIRARDVKTSLSHWVEEYGRGHVDEVQHGPTKLNGMNAYLVEDLDFGHSMNYYVKKQDVIYMVYYEIFADQRDEVIRTILESVELTEPQPATKVDLESDATGDWLTYTNEKYGYTVQYPPDWIYFDTIQGDEAVYDSAGDMSVIRFTSKDNQFSANAFVDITLKVSESFDDVYELPYTKHNNQYYIFNSGTWSTPESTSILNGMLNSLQFSK